MQQLALYDTPELRPCMFEAWPFQRECIDAVFAALRRYPRVLVNLFTGAGKTVVASLVCRRGVELGRKILFLVPTIELAQQTAEKFDLAGMTAMIEQAGQRARKMFEPHVVVGSLMTMKDAARLESFGPDYFDLIVVDEAHMAPTDSCKRVLAYFRRAKVIGLSATLKRSDEQDLGYIFDEVAYRFTLIDAWKAPAPGPYACDIVPIKCDLDIDLRKLKPQKGDFTDRDLDKRIGPMVEVMANKIKEHIGSRRTLVFLPSIRSSQAMAVALCSLGIAAEAVWGSDPDRAAKIKRYHAGETQVLCNMNLLTTGFDCLDMETEILTPGGWKGFEDVLLDPTQCYSLNRETGMVEVTPITTISHRPVYDGEKMFVAESGYANIRTTEGHEFHVKYRDPALGGDASENFLTKTGAELSDRRSAYFLPVSGDLDGGFVGLPLSDDEVRLIAWFMTDGSMNSERRCLEIYQSKPHFVAEIRELLDRLGLDYREYEKTNATAYKPNSKIAVFAIPKGTDGGTKRRNGWEKYEPYLDKDVSPAMHDMTREQFLVFWQEMLKGDGSVQPGKSGRLWTGRKTQLDAYSHMAVIRGFAFTHCVQICESGKEAYSMGIKPRKWLAFTPSPSRKPTVRLECPSPGEFVWCVTNRNSTIITRRRGKIAIIGNCPATSAIVLARPTRSHTLFLQMLGRGTRVNKEEKECIVLDFGWLTDDFPPVQSGDLLDSPGFDAEAADIARELLAATPGLSLKDAIEQAEVESEERKRRKKEYAIRVSIQEREVLCDEETYSMREAFAEGAEEATRTWNMPSPGVKKGSPKQIEMLKGWGYADAENWSIYKVRQTIGARFAQKAAGKSTIGQRDRLARKGVPVQVGREMSKDQADAALDVWEGRRQEVYGRRAR